jgi:rifampin ADP-ribosylating transferase
VPDEFIEAIITETLKVPARILKETLRGILDADPSANFGKIAARTLLIWGDRDAITPRSDQDAILRGIRGSLITVYEGAGHMVHWEKPERVAADLAVFVQGLSEAGS